MFGQSYGRLFRLAIEFSANEKEPYTAQNRISSDNDKLT